MPTDIDERKRRAAHAALVEVPREGIVGLGSGSTSHAFVVELARSRPDAQRGGPLTFVATSNATRSLAESLGLALLDDAGPWTIDVTIDGADEVSATLDLIKGGGGAHTREKIVNGASRRNVIVVDDGKLSTRLGERHVLPLEIVEFGAQTTLERLAAYARAGEVSTRTARSDAQNLLVDLPTGPIDDPAELDRALHAIAGVVETGLFVRRADVVYAASATDVKRLDRR